MGVSVGFGNGVCDGSGVILGVGSGVCVGVAVGSGVILGDGSGVCTGGVTTVPGTDGAGLSGVGSIGVELVCGSK